MDRAETGRIGERLCCDMLTRSKWAIVGRNWRTRRGEIDIIGVDGDTIVFVEVKTWPRGRAFDLERAIGPVRRKRLVETAKCFLDTHRQYSGMYVRFDVILIESDPRDEASVLYHHLKDAIAERAG